MEAIWSKKRNLQALSYLDDLPQLMLLKLPHCLLTALPLRAQAELMKKNE